MGRKTSREIHQQERADAERERLCGLLVSFGLADDMMALLAPVLDNLAWMRVRLEDTRKVIKTSEVVIPYDNGGGQSGLRENPAFKGYEALWKSYMTGLGRILDMLPKPAAKEIVAPEEKPKTVLEVVLNKHKKEA